MRGPPFADLRLALVNFPHPSQQSLEPVHQVVFLPFQPVDQATPHEHQVARRLQIHYDLPAGVNAVPGTSGTVLIPLQVENLSKKYKFRLQLAPTVRPSTTAVTDRCGA